MTEITVKKVKVQYGTKTMPCTCKNTLTTDYQDKTFGKGMRVFNFCKQGKELRCTCCTRVISKSGEQTSRGHSLQENILMDYCKIKETDLRQYIKN